MKSSEDPVYTAIDNYRAHSRIVQLDNALGAFKLRRLLPTGQWNDVMHYDDENFQVVLVKGSESPVQLIKCKWSEGFEAIRNRLATKLDEMGPKYDKATKFLRDLNKQ